MLFEVLTSVRQCGALVSAPNLEPDAWVQVLALPLTSCMTLGTGPNLSVPGVFHP